MHTFKHLKCTKKIISLYNKQEKTAATIRFIVTAAFIVYKGLIPEVYRILTVKGITNSMQHSSIFEIIYNFIHKPYGSYYQIFFL